MFYCFYLLLSVFGICHEVNSYNLIPLGSVTIPTTTKSLKIDELSYDKLKRSESGNVSLSFRLEGEAFMQNEQVSLEVNNIKQKDILILKTTDPSKTQIYITKEKLNDTILYTIKFDKFDKIVPGMYKLKVEIGGQTVSNSSFIFSVPIVKEFEKPKLGLEGDPMRITCIYEAYPNATEIQWKRLSNADNNPDKPGNISMTNSTDISPNDRIQFISGKDSKKENDTLYITKLLKSDSGLYMCVVKSPKGGDFSIVKINVKDRWAALYPFIGIVIEVVLLVTAILAYEKYQIRSQKKKNYGENVDDDNKDPDILLTNRAGDDENVTTDNEVQQNDADIDKTNNVDSLKPRETATTKSV